MRQARTCPGASSVYACYSARAHPPCTPSPRLGPAPTPVNSCAEAAFAGRPFKQDERYGNPAVEVGKDYDYVKGHEPKPVRFDEASALPVYKAAALGVSLPGSGMTKDCPFDCDCCF